MGVETWSRMLMEKRGLRVFEKRVLRRIFGPKRDEVTGNWRKVSIKEVYAPESSLNITQVIKEKRK